MKLASVGLEDLNDLISDLDHAQGEPGAAAGTERPAAIAAAR